jgi:putative tricarboxylic transport membrane protein
VGDGLSTRTTRIDPAGLAVAALLAISAGVLVWEASRIPLSQTYGLGPQAMPVVIAIGLGLLAIGNLVMALRGGLPARESADPGAILLILGGLAALIALIGLGGGFILATAVLFAATAAAFGRRALVIDFLIGVVLGLVVYLMFDKLLTLSLPAGPLERLL